MPAFSTAKSCYKSEAKSLFRNILAATPCGSRFCPDPPYPRARKLFAMKILDKRIEKNIERYHGVQ